MPGDRNIPLHHHLHDDVWNQHTDNDTTSVRSFKNAKNVTQTAEYRERLQACCRGEGRNEKLADDGVTIIVD